MNLKEHYLYTLRETLIGASYQDYAYPRRWLNRLLHRLGIQLAVRTSNQGDGNHWPLTALTMVGRMRLENIRDAIQEVDRHDIPGAFVECGVWRGGASIYAAACIALGDRRERQMYLCDTFAGLPKPKHPIDRQERFQLWRYPDVLAVSVEQVESNFRRFNLYTPNVKLVPGLFRDTLRHLPGPIAVLRADGDMYDSTRDILTLYPKVQRGGIVIIDDYRSVAGCKIAVDDFLKVRPGITIHNIDHSAIYWKKI